MRVEMPDVWGRRVLLAAAWVLALSGLLAMHALGTHGSAHGPGAPMTHEAAASAISSGDMTLGSTSDPARPTLSTPMTQVGGGLPGLCLAVLGGLALALILWLLGRRPRRSWTRARPSPLLRPVGRERDPPCLLRLSVMRC
jgi:hypothetical protein